MNPIEATVKRPYDASRRRDRARRQHEAALEHALALFLDRGFAATTVEAIAAASGVSVATITKSHGGKGGLVCTLAERALAGSAARPAEERSDDLVATGDVRTIFEEWGRLAAEVSPRISPLTLLLARAAETDPAAADLLARIEGARLRRMSQLAADLIERELLAPAVTRDEARDVLWWCTSPEFYDLMVNRRGWSRARFGRLVTATLKGTLTHPPAG